MRVVIEIALTYIFFLLFSLLFVEISNLIYYPPRLARLDTPPCKQGGAEGGLEIFILFAAPCGAMINIYYYSYQYKE
jgi:hypothetical protein